MPPAPLSTPISHRRDVFIGAAFLVLAALAAYQNSFSGPLVYDDVPAIKDNITIRQFWALSTVLSPPNDSGITVNGRPIVNLSLAINYAMGGTAVFGYHVFNLIVHIMAGLALFGIVRRSLQLPSLSSIFAPRDASLPIPLAVALIWMVHPLQTESVTYIIQRAESLVGLFYFLTFYCFLRALSSPRRTFWQCLAVLACVLGMGSKEVMASAPLMVLLYDRALVSGTFRHARERHQRLYFGLAATWVPLSWLVAQTGNRGGTAGFGAGGVSSWDYALTSALAIGKYVKLSFWPDPLVFDYGTAVQTELFPVLPQGLTILALLAATVYALVRRPFAGFLGVWFFAILGPSSSVIPIASEPMAEHRMYLPLAVVAAVFVGVMFRLLGNRAFAPILLTAVGAILLTAQRNDIYRDELLLWSDTKVSYPTNARAHNNVGEILFRREQFDEAIVCFREAVRLLPGYIDALNNLGNSLTQSGQAEEALLHLVNVLRENPKYPATHNNLGNAYHRLGRNTEALFHYREAVRLKPEFPEARNNLGVLLADQGNYLEAIVNYQEAIRRKERYIDAHYNYGNSLQRVGRTQEAIDEFRTTIALKPTHAEAHNNLGGLFFALKKNDLAESGFRKAIQLKPDYPEALNNLGAVLVETNKSADALPFFERAIQLKPDYKDARNNLAELHNLRGANFVEKNQLAEAQAAFEEALVFNPLHPGAHHNRGVVLWRLGRSVEAVKCFEEAIRLSPDFPEAIDGLAKLRKSLLDQ